MFTDHADHRGCVLAHPDLAIIEFLADSDLVADAAPKGGESVP